MAKSIDKKAIITSKIFMSYNKDLYEKCKEALTYTIPNPDKRKKEPIKFCILSKVGERILGVPVGREDLIPDDYEIVDKRATPKVKFPKFKFTLGEEQEKVYNQVTGNCLINADPSWGKTFTGIAIATKLSYKTLVITHTTSLRDQWKDEIKKTLGINAGVIGGGKMDIENKSIVVSNIQTLRKFVGGIKDEFGTVIVDECHHTPSKVFTEVLNRFNAKVKIGLSATLTRKDQMHVVLKDYFSTTVYKGKGNNSMTPKILMVKTGIPLESSPLMPWANKITKLINTPGYKELCLEFVRAYEKSGHKVLFLSDRLEMLEYLSHRLGDKAHMVDSSVKPNLRDEYHKDIRQGKKNILLGSLSIYKEGISINNLSCLVLGAVVNNNPLLTQLVGRIKRKHEGKKKPVLVDFVLSGTTATNQARARYAHYIDEGYEVYKLDLNDPDLKINR